MPFITCPNVIDCPGSDWPILNLSSEGPDNLVFVGTVYDPFNPYNPPPVDGRLFTAHDCYGTSFSVESQEIAELIAQVNAIICGNPPIPDPLHPEDPPRQGYCLNDEQTATIVCGTGTEVTATVAAGTIARPSNGNDAACLAAANAQALALAQQRVAALSLTDCQRCNISTNSPLPNGSIGVPYAVQLVSNMAEGATWSLIGGALPPGLSLSLTGLISGTPTTGGSYTFAPQVRLRAGSCYKNLQISIAAAVFPMSYFKCDEPDGAPYLVDSITARHLVRSFGTTVSIPGKIAGGIALGNGINTTFQDGPDAHWAFSGSFTVRFWFMSPSASINNFLFGTGSGNQWGIAYRASDALLSFSVLTTSGPLVVELPVTQDGSWHQFVFWFEQGVGAGGKVDNGVSITSAGSDPIQGYINEVLYLQNTHFWGPGVAIDEIGLWDRKLTDAELTTDWHGGNGTTYP